MIQALHKKMAILLSLGLAMSALTIVVAQAATSVTTSRQLVKTDIITTSYQDIANGINMGDYNHMLITVSHLPANAEIIASHMKVTTPFKDSSDPNMQPYGTFTLQTDNTNVNEPLATGDLAQTGVQTNVTRSKDLIYDFTNDIKFDVSIPQGQDNLTNLTSGEIVLYISYISY